MTKIKVVSHLLVLEEKTNLKAYLSCTFSLTLTSMAKSSQGNHQANSSMVIFRFHRQLSPLTIDSNVAAVSYYEWHHSHLHSIDSSSFAPFSCFFSSNAFTTFQWIRVIVMIPTSDINCLRSPMLLQGLMILQVKGELRGLSIVSLMIMIYYSRVHTSSKGKR